MPKEKRQYANKRDLEYWRDRLKTPEKITILYGEDVIAETLPGDASYRAMHEQLSDSLDTRMDWAKEDYKPFQGAKRQTDTPEEEAK